MAMIFINTKIKYIAQIFGRIGFRGYTERDLTDEGNGAITLSPSNFQDMKMNYEHLTYLSWKKYNESPEIKIHNGDILFVKTGSTYGKSCYVQNLPMEATINPQLIVFKNIKINPKLFSYILQTTLIKNQCELAVVGGTIPTMSQKKIGNFLIKIPSYRKDQDYIANYLDSKCAKIDSIKKNIEAEIEALKQYKRSVITETVTKGLDKNVEMKDSGYEWIGKIPKAWEIVPFGAFLDNIPNSIVDGPFGSDMKNNEYVDKGVPVIQLGAIRDHGMNFANMHYITEEKANSLIRHNAYPNDIVIAKMMPAGKTCEVPDKFSRYVVSADVIKATISNRYLRKFLVYAFNAYCITQAQYESQGATRARVNIHKVKRFKIAKPTSFESKLIVDYLDTKCAKIDSIIQKKQELLANLDTYKKSLIYECVTGKKEVPVV